MSLFARSGAHVRKRSRNRRSARSSTSSWKSGTNSSASLSGSLYGRKDLQRSYSARVGKSQQNQRSASFHDVHGRRSRSSSARNSFGGHASDLFIGTLSFKVPGRKENGSFYGVKPSIYRDTSHLTLQARNSYGGQSVSSTNIVGKDFRRTNSQRSARSFVGFDNGDCNSDLLQIRRSSSRKSSHSYTDTMQTRADSLHINRSNSQRSARSNTGYSLDSHKFQRSRSERVNRSNNVDRKPTFYLEDENAHPTTQRRIRHLSDTPNFVDNPSWDRQLSRRSRYSLPGEVTGFFKPSPSWVRHGRNKSIGSIGLCGSLLYVDLNTPVFDDVISDVMIETESRCESYLSPHCECHKTEMSFDDERQLVRTTVGWNPRTGEEHQPDYGAFSYQLHEAGKESENVIEFACKTSTIICNTLLVTVLVGISMTLPITMVSMGVKYLDDCPKEPRIPVYLLVGGCFGMIKLLSSLWRNIQARRYQDIELVFDDNDDSDSAFASTTYRTMDAILFLFLVGWQIAGTYWTLEIWKPLFKQKLHEPSNWCDETVYMFTVYQIFGCYSVMAFYLLVLILLTLCYRCCKCRRN